MALFKKNSTVEVLVWHASKIHEASNLRANIWSGHLCNWKEKEVVKAEFSIFEKPMDAFKDDEYFKICEVLSP